MVIHPIASTIAGISLSAKNNWPQTLPAMVDSDGKKLGINMFPEPVPWLKSANCPTGWGGRVSLGSPNLRRITYSPHTLKTQYPSWSQPTGLICVEALIRQKLYWCKLEPKRLYSPLLQTKSVDWVSRMEGQCSWRWQIQSKCTENLPPPNS